jgi:ketosteroid isomerase-like protein
MVSTVEGSPGRLEELDFLCPDVEIDVRELVDGRILRGRDAVRAYLDSLRSDVWRDLTMRVEAIAEQGDALIATVRLQGTGRRSGVPVDMRAAWRATLREGRVASARLTLDYDGAVSAPTPPSPPPRARA